MSLAEGQWLSSTALDDEQNTDSEPTTPMDDSPPQHPVPTMQGAFEESMMETMADLEPPEIDVQSSKADSVSRRKMLLEQDKYERTVAGRWKQKDGEKFHPLWKLVAQISFGMHLLHRGLAKSDDEVIKILQTHVDEVDGFLERTTEDFDLAQGDINERIRYLKLPLEHGHVFDTMLNDRSFRTAIVEGNEKIEHIVDRTAAAMRDALKDVQKGLDATRELAKYLTRLDKSWDDRSEEHGSVYLAMIGNTEGWSRAFISLQQKGNKLGISLVQLGGIIAEMQRRAGIASRRNLVPAPSRSVEGKFYVEPKSASRSPMSPSFSTSPKPLPQAPSGVQRPVQGVPPPKQAQQALRPKPRNDPSQEAPRTARRQPSKDALHQQRKQPSREVLRKKSTPTLQQSARIPEDRSRSISKPVSKPVSKPISKPVTPARVATPKAGSRKPSLSDRLLGRKASYMTDTSEAASTVPTPKIPTEKSPTSSPRASPVLQLKKIDSNKPIDPHELDGAVQWLPPQSPFTPFTYPASPDSRSISSHSLVSHQEFAPVELEARDDAQSQSNKTDSLVMDVLTAKVASGSFGRPKLRDLPLRHYHSQESLDKSHRTSHSELIVSVPPKRWSSVRNSPTLKAELDTNQSSSYTQPGLQTVKERLSHLSPAKTMVLNAAKRKSAYSPAELSGEKSSFYSPNNESVGQLSVYSPDGAARDGHALFASNLSPPPDDSSAAPSPLQITLRSGSAPDSLAISELPGSTVPSPRRAGSIPPSIQTAPLPDTKTSTVTIAKSHSGKDSSQPGTPRSYTLFPSPTSPRQPRSPMALQPLTSFSSTKPAGTKTPRSDDPGSSAALIDFFTDSRLPPPSTPSSKPTTDSTAPRSIPIENKTNNSFAISDSTGPSEPTALPRCTTSTAEDLSKIPSPTLDTILPPPTTYIDSANSSPQIISSPQFASTAKPAKSGWRKVFGNNSVPITNTMGGGSQAGINAIGGVGSAVMPSTANIIAGTVSVGPESAMGKRGKSVKVVDVKKAKGPKKSKSERKREEKEREGTLNSGTESGNPTSGGSGFMGVGKDGVWISRKNFVKT